MTAPADVMCTLCGMAGVVDTDVSNPEALATALAWAAHFAADHPGVKGGVSRYVVSANVDVGVRAHDAWSVPDPTFDHPITVAGQPAEERGKP